MRHKKSGRQFGRDTSSRRAMLRNLAANLITHERIETTDAKAKELRRIADRLITNFHMPESTLLMLAAAFGGRDLIMKAYKKAIKEGYRFYSYGDAMMII